jgi:hypothetical protein
VVIVDGMPETAQVLQAVFEPRGHRVERIRGFVPNDAERVRDSVLVLHDDGEKRAAANDPAVRRIIIGSLSSPNAGSNETHLSPMFEFAELIRAVEGLLSDQKLPARRAA